VLPVGQWHCSVVAAVNRFGLSNIAERKSPDVSIWWGRKQESPVNGCAVLMLQPDTVQSAVGYESTTQEINVVRDLIDNHQQLFGVRLSVIHF